MTLSDLSSIVGVISGLAVLGSLVYLAQQTRQNAKHTQALIQQGRAMQSTDMPLRWAEDASLAEIRLRGDKGDPSMDEVQLSRYSLMKVSVFWYFEDQFHQHRDGLVEDGRFAGTVKTIEVDFQRPGFRVVWKQARHLFGAEYRSFMDDIFNRTRATVASDPIAAWKTSIDAELSEASA